MALPFRQQRPEVPPVFQALLPLIESEFTESTLKFYLNGAKVELQNPNPAWTLLDFIRSRHGHQGTKLGCGEGGCGACTVVLQSIDPHRGHLRHVAVNACLYPLVGVVGKHLITIEGLGNVNNPHPLQERIAKLHGSQCGFCTPGIVMSLYALIRNSYDSQTNVFDLSAENIELEGALDGNLCRCTGYKPILQAAKTFIVEDLQAKVKDITCEEKLRIPVDSPEIDFPYRSETVEGLTRQSPNSCGRPGGCCRDRPRTDSSSEASDSSRKTSRSASENESNTSSEVAVNGGQYGKPIRARERNVPAGQEGEGIKADTSLDAPPPKDRNGMLEMNFEPYKPATELIFPPALGKFKHSPICYGNANAIWLRPSSLDQLIRIKSLDPTAKLVSGSSEVQVEIRFKNSKFVVSVFVGDLEELTATFVPKSDAEIASMKELVVGANTSLTDLEKYCQDLAPRLGRRGLVLEAARKQLRYFAGRQIRNAASLAGNISTASPISDMNPVLLAAGATIMAKSVSVGVFALPMATFFKSYRVTSLPADAVIVQIRIPLPLEEDLEIFKAYKQAKRKDDDIAIVTSGFKVKLNSKGRVEQVSLAYGGMAPMTVFAKGTMKVLTGLKWNDSKTLEKGLAAIGKDFDLPFGVPGGMATYRRTLAMSFFFRFWHEVISELHLGHVEKDLIEEIHRSISSGTRDNYNPHEQRVVGRQVPHLSALKQATGEAEYIDDVQPQHRELHGAFVFSLKAHAKILEIDWSPALGPGFALGYIDRNDISPEQNRWGSIHKDEPIFAEDEVMSHGQIIGMVYAESAIQAQAAARAVKVKYQDLPHILTIDEAIEAKSFFKHGKQLRKGAAVDGTMNDVFQKCDRIFEGVVSMGGQEHFYLETNAAFAIPHVEDGSMDVWSSTQNT